MTDVKWIKIVTDIFDDEKVLLIESMPEADAIIVIWFKLLCLAGKQNNSGVFLLNGRIAYTEEMFATIFRRPVGTVRLALKTFEQFGMIEIVNDTVTIPNWEKHQQMDALEASREATKSRVAKYREKQKRLTGGRNVTGNVTGNVTVTVCNADRIDKNREEKRREEIDKDDEENAGACACTDNPYGIDGYRGPGETAETTSSVTPRRAAPPSHEGEGIRNGVGLEDTVQRYALDNLRTMTPGHIQEFNEFLEVHGVSEDVMRYAIDVACGNGAAVWNYVAQILYGWLDAGVKSVDDAKAEQKKHRRQRDGPKGNAFGLDRRNNKVPEQIGKGIVV